MLRPTWLLALVLGLFLIGRVETAWAGAWNEPAGHGVVILTGTFDQGNRSFDSAGKLARTTLYTKREASAYVEYGVTDWLQAIVKPDLVSTRVGGAPGGHYEGFGTSEAGAQIRLLVFGPAVLAVQGTFQLPSTTRQRNLALVGNTSRNTDVRGLLGVAFGLGAWPSFLDAEAGYRVRLGTAPEEIHVDLAVGTRPRPDLLFLLQSFTVLPVGPGSAWFPRSDHTNAEGSVVYDLNERWAVQFGLFATVMGQNALREHGIDLAAWYRF